VAATLRVVTWNIRSAIGTGPFPDRWWTRIDADRLRAIGDFLGSVDADLVALQEVAMISSNGDLVDNPGALGRQLGMQVRYGAVRTFPVTDGDTVTGAGTFGNAILTRLPIHSAHTVALPAAPMHAVVEPDRADHPSAGVRYADAPPSIREPRCLLMVELDGWTAGTAHFSHIGSGERLLQSEATAAAFGGASPALLVGDLNAPIDALELAPFAGWTDAFTEPAGDPARISTDDGWRIDHVLARASVHGCHVLREAGDLSDHFPLEAEISVA